MWVHLEPFCYCSKLAAKHTKLVQLMQKFVPRCLVRIFTTNAPDPNHRTLNSCFVVYVSVRVHFGPFRYCTKLGAKRAKLVQLMQMFMPRCRARIFRNERSRSTPLDPKLMFWCVFSVWVHLEPFCYCTKLTAKRTKLVQLMQKFMPQCLVRIFCNERS